MPRTDCGSVLVEWHALCLAQGLTEKPETALELRMEMSQGYLRRRCRVLLARRERSLGDVRIISMFLVVEYASIPCIS